MVTVASGDKYPRACRCHRGSPRRHECAPALRRLQVLVLAPPQASERQDRRIHELGSLSFFSLPDCGELSLRFSGLSAKQIDTWQKTAGGYFPPASPRAWAAYRAARRARDDVTPPTPRWTARGNSGRRSCRWQRRRIRKAFALPVDGGAACRTEMKGQHVSTFGCPHPRRSLTGEGDLLAAEARLVADHGASAAHGRKRGGAGGQMQKLSAVGKFHFEPPFTSFDHLVGHSSNVSH